MTVIMLEENNNTCVRGGEHQCSHIDNETVSSVQDSTKSVVGDSDHNLQEVSTKDSTLAKESMIMTLTKGLCSLKDAIAENGIKYILYLLDFYLFDTISSTFLGFKEYIEAKCVVLCNKNCEKRNRRRQINQKRRRKQMENNDSNDRPLTKFQNDEKDSDSSRNQSSNGSNVTAINIPLNCKNIDSCTSHAALKTPTDIPTEKHSFNKTQFPINISQDTKSCANERSNVTQNKFPKFYIQKQRSNFSVNKGITRIFRQKSIFSDNMHSLSSFPRSFAFDKYRKSKQTNFFYNSKFSNYSLIDPWLKNETEQKKGLYIKFAPTNEKKKLTYDKEKNEKHTEQRNKKETQEEKRSFRRHSPTKYKSHYSRMPMGNKESKQNNLEYKEASTQTDSAFSTNNNVRMVSVGTMCPEQQFYTCETQKSQDRDMNQGLNYTASNEISEERLLSIAYQLLSSNSTSSSSTDSFDEHISAPPNTNIAANLWSTDLFNSTNTFETSARFPPGFPEAPQNPPLARYNYNPEHLMVPSLKDNYDSNSHIKPSTAVPKTPSSPTRYPYYNYHEYMEPPTYGNSSNVLY